MRMRRPTEEALMRGLWLVMWFGCALPALASADEPVVMAEPSGEVRGAVHLAASPEAVRARLADSAELARASEDVVSAVAEPVADCDRLVLKVRGLFSPFHVETERCPTPDGWSENLVASSMFTEWRSDWVVMPLADGTTRVEYVVYTELDAPVPMGMVRQRTVRSVRRCLERLQASLAPASLS